MRARRPATANPTWRLWSPAAPARSAAATSDLKPSDVAQRPGRHCFLNPGHPCWLQLVKVQLSDLTKERVTTSGRPSSTARRAAASSRRLRLVGSLSSAARLIAETATTIAPRCCARVRPVSSSSATSSCSPASNAARCHARRSGWSASTGRQGLVTRRALSAALCTTAERMSGCRKRSPEIDLDDARFGAGTADVKVQDLLRLPLAPPPGSHRSRLRRRGRRPAGRSRVASARSETRATNARSSRSSTASRPASSSSSRSPDHSRQFEPCQGISGGFPQDPAPLTQAGARHPTVEQLSRRGVSRPAVDSRQPRIAERRRVAVANGRQQDDRVGNSICRATNAEHVRGRRVQPLRIIDDQQNRRLRGSLRDQVKRCHGNPEMLGPPPRP